MFLTVSTMALAAKQQTIPTREGTRASVTFPADLYAELERIAEAKKVSVAWVVRDAAEKYVEAQYPLFRRETTGQY
jgi:metal-responsive CopG/Arc/MetJ family transcriptional regulator